QPGLVALKPVSPSSMMSSAPCSRQSAASCSLKPAAGGTTPMLAGQASVITQAMSSGRVANTWRTASGSLYGSTIVSAAAAPVTPGESGSPNVGTPDPAAASSASP